MYFNVYFNVIKLMYFKMYFNVYFNVIKLMYYIYSLGSFIHIFFIYNWN